MFMQFSANKIIFATAEQALGSLVLVTLKGSLKIRAETSMNPTLWKFGLLNGKLISNKLHFTLVSLSVFISRVKMHKLFAVVNRILKL